MSTVRLKLLEVLVQPVFVYEDQDGYLSKLAVDPITVDSREWSGFATERFVQLKDALDAEIEAGAHRRSA